MTIENRIEEIFEKGGPGSGPRPGGGSSQGKTAEEIKAIGEKYSAQGAAKPPAKETAQESGARNAARDIGAAIKGKDPKEAIAAIATMHDAAREMITVHIKERDNQEKRGDTGGMARSNFLVQQKTGQASAYAAAHKELTGKDVPLKPKLEKAVKKYEGLVVKGCTPTQGEDQKHFIGRCISDFMDAGKDQDQATAICFSTWTGKIDKANSRTVNMTPEPDENESDFMDRCTAYHSGQGNDSLAETICSRAWDNKTDSGGLGVDIQSESSLSPGFLQVKRP